MLRLGQVLANVQQVAHQGVLAFPVFDGGASADFFDGAKRFDDQNAVMGDNGAPAFADDLRVRHLLLVANLADVKNDVVGVFLQRVIGRAVGGRPAAVVIDAQSAADVEGLDGKAHFVKLGVKAGRFLHGLLDGQNIRHLRADVEMEQLETMLHFFRPQHLGGGQQFGRVQAEFGIFPAAVRPFAGAFAQQARADAHQRLDPHLARHGDDLLELLELLHHHDDLLAQLDAHEGHADKQGVLVTVANNQAAVLALQRQAGEQLRLAPHFQPELVRLARVQYFLHHFPQLVDLDGKDAAIFVLIIELGNGGRESLVDGLDPVAENVLKPNQHREISSPAPWPPRSRRSCPPPRHFRARAWRRRARPR